MNMNQSSELSKLLSKTFKLWIIFLLVINFLSFLPHYKMHFLSWLNYSIYFLLGVLSYHVSKRDAYLKDIFLQFTIAFWAVTATLLVYFVGEERLIGDDFLFYDLFFYTRLISAGFLSLAVIYLTMRYAFWKVRKWLVYIFSLLILLACENDLIIDIFRIPDYALQVANMGLIKHTMRMDIVSIAGLIIYGLILYLKDRPNGAFVNFFMVSLLISFSFDFFDIIVVLNQIDVYGIDQYFAIFCILNIGVALFLRLVALFSDGFLLREQFIFDSRFAISTPIILKESQFPRTVEQLKDTFHNQGILIQAVLGTIFILISGLAKSLWVSGKMILTVVLMVIFWNVYIHIFKHRIKKGQILNFRFTNDKIQSGK